MNYYSFRQKIKSYKLRKRELNFEFLCPLCKIFVNFVVKKTLNFKF